MSGALRLLSLLVVLSASPDEAAAAPPTFSETTPTRSVAENTAPNTAIGTAVSATDPDVGQNLIFALGGTDADKFDIDSATGQLRTKASLDFETSSSHSVTVTATDDGSPPESAMVTVTISVTDVAPGLTGPAAASYAEGVKGRRAATYTVSDGDTWSLAGTDASAFSITGGFLRFTGAPDHESPSDGGADNVYDVTVQASDGATTETQAVKVTVTDVNEPGAVTLNASTPKVGSALTASVSDDDSPTGVTWRWERSNGRLTWETITGATSATYTPTAAESGRLLRATASYTDDHGAGQSATAATPHAVLARRLSSLSMTTTGSGRAMYPAFDSDTLHYAAECATGAWTLTASAEEATTRLAVDGVQKASSGATVEFSGLGRERDIKIELANANGASTTYVVHCFGSDFPILTATGLSSGVAGELLLFVYRSASSAESYLILADRNGVPRVRKFVPGLNAFPRFFDDAPYAYAYALGSTGAEEWILLNKDFSVGRRGIRVVSPIAHTDPHDFLLRPNGDYLFMSYNWARRDFSFLSTEHGLRKKVAVGVPTTGAHSDTHRPCRATDTGCVDWVREDTRDSAIQLRTAGGAARLNWNSWGSMAIEDCLTHRFVDDYAHINSFHWDDGGIVASFRGCNKVLRINSATGNVEWRVGRSIWSREEWEAGGSSGAGPAPLAIVGDPHEEFCGQHGAALLPNGNLLLYDNGVHCFVDIDSWDGSPRHRQFSRAVEYALDLTNGEAVFQRHHSLHSGFDRVGLAAGHVEALDNGDWLITWGRGFSSGTPLPPDVTVTQVDPRTNDEKFSLKVARPSAPNVVISAGRAVAVPPVALAAAVEPLTARIVRSDASHTGAQGSPQVVVAFNQPVADPATDTPSVSVTGATVSSVAAHRESGAAANAYVFTLAPAGDGNIRFQLTTGRWCSANGICTAAGGTLSSAPAATCIPGPSESCSPSGGGGGGGGLVRIPELTVNETPEVGENEYRSGVHEVTLRREAGTPAVRLAVPGLLSADTTITVAPVAADVPLTPGAFAFGPPDARSVVDITVDPAPEGGLTLCLPVTPALLEAAADQPLTLLHYADGEWAEVPGAYRDVREPLICAKVTEFSPFAAGFRAPPGVPIDMTVEAGAASSLEVRWTAPPDTGARLAAYELQYRPAGAETWTDHVHADLATAATIGGLTPNTDYEVRLRSLGDGESEWVDAAGRTRPLDETASRAHLFPLFADGDGFRSHIFVTEVSDADNRCQLTLHGPGLDAAAFEPHPALTASTTGIGVDLDETGATVAFETAGEGRLAFGYAKLSCEQPAVAHMLLISESGGEPFAMTHLESERTMNVFQFPVLPRLDRLGLVLANDNDLAAACAVEVATAEGESAGGDNIAVPAQSAAVWFLDEQVPQDEGAAAATARVTCDRPVAALGVPLYGGDFAALAGVDLETADPADGEGESRWRRILPLVQDGGGFQSNLLVTNLSDSANACSMYFDLPGVPSAKFQTTAGVTWDGSRRAILELAGPGSQITLPSANRSVFASFSYAALDCDAPADVRNLLTAHGSAGPAGIASIAPVQPAREVRFPVLPRLGSFALVLTNAAETDASCKVALTLAEQDEPIAAGSPVHVEGESTAIRFLADLFELPGDFPGGEAALLCDREIMAVALPATAGAAFTAVPPAVR